MRVILFISLFVHVLFTCRAQQPEIDVVLNNIKNAKGEFVISFYNDANNFPKPGRETFIQKVPVNDTLSHTVKCKLPAKGWYAIAMFQDEDETGKIKQDKIGIPLEAFAFSNNIHPKTAAPSFAACKFYVEEKDNSPISISLIQPKFLRRK